MFKGGICMKKNKAFKICGFSIGCVASFMAGFALKKEHFDRMITDNAVAYYNKYSHTVDEIYRIKDDAFDDGKIDVCDIEFSIPNGYIVTGIHYDETKKYRAKVSYINDTEVIDINDGSLFGIPATEFNEDYSKAAKRLYLKSH